MRARAMLVKGNQELSKDMDPTRKPIVETLTGMLKLIVEGE